jgi:hypothetical protein
MFKRLRMLSGIGVMLSLALCGSALADGDLSSDLRAEPALAVLDEDADVAPFSYIVEHNLSYEQTAEYFYPSLDNVLITIPIPSIKPKRAAFRPVVSTSRKQVQATRKDFPVRVRRVSAPNVSTGRKITERMPIIVGLFR